jgi:hypothetical protein
VIALGRRLGRKHAAGWLAAAAFVLSQGVLYAAYEVRAYGLALALLAWSSVFLWELWEHYTGLLWNRRFGLLLAGYLVLAVGLLYTHYTGILALAVHGVYVGARTLAKPSRRRFLILACLGLGLALAYIPWLVALSGRDVRAGTAYEGSVKPGFALKTYVEFYAYGQNVPPHELNPYRTLQYWYERLPDTYKTVQYQTPAYGWSIVSLVMAALLFGGVYERKNTGVFWGVLAVALPLLGLIIMVYQVQGKLSGRHGWPVWFGASLLIGIGFSTLSRFRWLRWPVWLAVLLVIWLPTTANLSPSYNSHMREAFTYVKTNAEPGDVLVLRDGTLFTAAGYYDPGLPWIGLPSDRLTNVHRFLTLPEALNELDGLIDKNGARRVWVVAWQGHIMDPQDLIAGILEYIGEPQPIAQPFGDVYVSLYTLHDTPYSIYERVTALEPLAQAPLHGPTYYGGYVLESGPVPHGSLIHIQTWWRRGRDLMPGLRVSVRLYGSDGMFYSQIDQPPVAWAFGQDLWISDSPILSRFALWVPYEIPAGQVEAKIILYDVNNEFLPITASITSFEVRD